MGRRSLALRRELLAELTSGDLGSVVAGAPLPSGETCPLLDCLSGTVCTLTGQPRCF